MVMVREYGNMTYDAPNSVYGYKFLHVQWNMDTARTASWNVAQDIFKENGHKSASLKSLLMPFGAQCRPLRAQRDAQDTKWILLIAPCL
jgi:hypothetical protein